MGRVYRAGGRVLYEPIWAGPGLFPVRLLRDLSAFTFLLWHDGWSPLAAISDGGSSAVITRRALFNLPHGVNLTAVALGDGENETQVLSFAWLMLTFISLLFSYRSWVKLKMSLFMFQYVHHFNFYECQIFIHWISFKLHFNSKRTFITSTLQHLPGLHPYSNIYPSQKRKWLIISLYFTFFSTCDYLYYFDKYRDSFNKPINCVI